VSFSITASGTRDEVVAQLEHRRDHDSDTSDARADALRKKAADLLIAAIGADDLTPVQADYENRYYITASGHAGGHYGTTLNIQVTPHYVPKTTAKASKE
jgi:hypothetical protein